MFKLMGVGEGVGEGSQPCSRCWRGVKGISHGQGGERG